MEPFAAGRRLMIMTVNNIWPLKPSKHQQFEQIVQPHLKKLYQLAYRFTGQRADAEDLVQDVLIKVFPRLDEMVSIEKPGSWLARVLYRHFIDKYRGQQRSILQLVDDASIFDSFADESQGPAQDMGTSQLQNRLESCLGKLNDDQRLLVILHDVEGYTLQEIHSLHDVSIGTLKSRLNRARSRLRDLLKNMEPFDTDKRVNE